VASRDRYHDENGVLFNKLGITDAQKLFDVEYLYSTAKARSWEHTPHPELRFDLARQKAIHHHLFEPIYEWAGKQRTTSLSKGIPNTRLVSIFQEPKAIESGWHDLATRIDAFVTGEAQNFPAKREQLVDIFVTANSLHAFAEGNGRSLQVFMRDLAKAHDIVIDYSKVAKTEWNVASAMSGQLAKRFEGDYFAYPSDRTLISKVYEQIASPARERTTPARQPFVMTEKQQQEFNSSADTVIPQSARAIAFATLPPDQAMARHPELGPLFSALNAFREGLAERFPDDSYSRDQYLAKARADILDKLNSGAPLRTLPPSSELDRQ
jgi:cell filamentation protein